MRSTFRPQPTTLAILIAAIFAPAAVWADQLPLAQYPAGTAYKSPIPNVIVTVDTSGSMGTQDLGSRYPTRLQYVVSGLKSTLTNSTKYDDQFRLAWQSFACNGIPSNSGNCGNKNTMAKFSGSHKTDFNTWLNTLTANGTTPSPSIIWTAGEYLKTTGNNSPWKASPGDSTDTASPLACRRAYHIFLTDGGWNFKYTDPIAASFKTGMTLPSQTATIPVQNADGKATTFPDSTAYTVATTNPQTKIYRDAYGTSTRTTGSRSSTTYYAYPTMADMAFYYWATDLQPGIPDQGIQKIRKSGQETFTSGSQSVTFDEYWNPRNDPATWQHLVQYTIGYGPSASSLKKLVATSPQFPASEGTFGMMYGAGFSDLAVGKTYWDDATSTTADNNYDDWRPQEMWHMAINSRGKFYPVSGGDLTGVFADIFDDIIVDTTSPISGFTSASGSVSRMGTIYFQSKYIAADDPNSNDNRWYGYVVSNSLSTTGVSTPNPDWLLVNGKNKTTADKLGEISNLSNRLILSYDILNASANKGISFKWANLSTSTTGASDKMWLNKGTVGTGTAAAIATAIAGDGNGQDRLNFIRGDRSKEVANGGTFRNRKNIEGDIVNSAIWYAGPPASGYATASYNAFANAYRARLPMIYVGGNDGMLHGFSTEDGTEKIAYVPHGAIQNLAKLTDPLYSHHYYVDGSPMSGDIDIGAAGSPDWRTFLVGTLGAGGRGYFVLDVTKPGSKKNTTSVTDSFIEANASSLVVMDKTAAAVSDAAPPAIPEDPNADPNIGHIFNTPVVSDSNSQRTLQITRTNDNRWAFITGNGYDSANGSPVLLIQYLDGDKSLKTITTSSTACPAAVAPKGNGLSAPQFLDVNGDGSPDFVYAGDLCGNMWKFDISNSSSSNWGVAFNGNPLFTATYTTVSGSSSRQPITAPATLSPNSDVGGLMVAFGTGQNLAESDRTDVSTQTVYSILDNTRYEIESSGTNKGKVKIKTSLPTPTTVGGRSNLVAESVTGGTGSGTAGTGISAGRSFWKLSNGTVSYACAAGDTSCTVKMGWYMDLPVQGERVTTGIGFYDGSNILEILSEKPASGSATASGEEVCAPQPQAAQPFRTLIGIASGKAPTPPVMNANGDTSNGIGVYDSSDQGFARMTASSKELGISTSKEQVRIGSDGKVDKMANLPELLVRPNWRQLK